MQFESHFSGLLLYDESLHLLLFHTVRLSVTNCLQPTARDTLVCDIGPQYKARSGMISPAQLKLTMTVMDRVL
jgi:hypothetical protein